MSKNHYSQSSEEALLTAHPFLRTLFQGLLPLHDHTVVWGYRGEKDQNRLYREGKSTKEWGESKHNIWLGESSPDAPAVDIYPHVDGRMVTGDKKGDAAQLVYFSGIVIGRAESLGIPIRWGGNWDMDDIIVTDQTFNDLGHYELMT